MRDPNERYHDHVAGIYDDIYSSPYWDFYRQVSWDHMKEHLPRDLSVRVHDAGCGTGTFGLMFLKAGFRVLFSDLSRNMLDRARAKVEEAGYADRAEFRRLDIADLSALEDGSFGFFCAQGDPLSLCRDAKAALRGVARTLAPGGIAALSVDNRASGYEHFLEKGDLDGLLEFQKKGELTWLAERRDERFPYQAFDVEELEKMAAAAGLKRVAVIGKTVLPLRKHPALLEARKAFQALLKLEKKLNGRVQNLGCAAHLQAIFRRA